MMSNLPRREEVRGNLELLGTGTAVAPGVTYDFSMGNYLGVTVYVDITAIAGTANAVVSLFEIDPINGDEYAAALLATGTLTAAAPLALTIAPGATVSNRALGIPAPRKLRVKITGTHTTTTHVVKAERY